MERYKISGKVIFVTGSSRGIGRATVLAFAKQGCKVIVTYFSGKDEAVNVAKECADAGAADTMVVQLNITDNKSIAAAIKKTVEKFGKIFILVNNAGVVVMNRFEKQTMEDIEKQVRTNLEGTMKMTHECLPHVEDAIINVASIAGKIPYETVAPYCGTKFGIRGFTQTLALERKDIRFYCVNPGITATRMTNFRGRPPEQVADVIVNAAKGVYKVKSGADIDIDEILK
ncbi:MAG: SDR family oxidoreductase [Candidatus Aenigmatarchaeota archaeon]